MELQNNANIAEEKNCLHPNSLSSHCNNFFVATSFLSLHSSVSILFTDIQEAIVKSWHAKFWAFSIPFKNYEILRFPVLTKLCNVLKEWPITKMFCDDLLSSQTWLWNRNFSIAYSRRSCASVLVGSCNSIRGKVLSSSPHSSQLQREWRAGWASSVMLGSAAVSLQTCQCFYRYLEVFYASVKIAIPEGMPQFSTQGIPNT